MKKYFHKNTYKNKNGVVEENFTNQHIKDVNKVSEILEEMETCGQIKERHKSCNHLCIMKRSEMEKLICPLEYQLRAQSQTVRPRLVVIITK